MAGIKWIREITGKNRTKRESTLQQSRWQEKTDDHNIKWKDNTSWPSVGIYLHELEQPKTPQWKWKSNPKSIISNGYKSSRVHDDVRVSNNASKVCILGHDFEKGKNLEMANDFKQKLEINCNDDKGLEYNNLESNEKPEYDKEDFSQEITKIQMSNNPRTDRQLLTERA